MYGTLCSLKQAEVKLKYYDRKRERENVFLVYLVVADTAVVEAQSSRQKHLFTVCFIVLKYVSTLY